MTWLIAHFPAKSFLALLLLLAGVAAAKSAPGAPSAAKDVEKQGEGDWVDARWDRVVLGNFLASNLPLPNGTIAKGLSVRIGLQGDAAVAYDTGSASWRAGWTGHFLKFNDARYGLVLPPTPSGPIQLLAPTSPAWGDAAVQWRGFHVHGERVVLHYDVAGSKVLESPWSDTWGKLRVFTRTFELDRRDQPGTLALLEGKGRKGSAQLVEGGSVMMLTGDTNSLLVAALGVDGLELQLGGGLLKLHLPAITQTRRIRVLMSAGAAGDSAEFISQLKRLPPAEDLASLAKPGPARWQPLTTRGQRGPGTESYAIDTLTIPYENPWQALFFASGVDFLPNGDAAVCTLHGDVWLVSGIDASLNTLTWRRYATGLFQPLGLRVRDGAVFVLGRDRITRLKDQNGDGEADEYESFFGGIHTSTSGHDFVTSLESDTNGQFYYVDPAGLHRVNPAGTAATTIATGWRNPNGMGASPDGSILMVAPQQGDWTPSSSICEAHEGGYYGYGGPKPTPARPLGFDPPLCWIPHAVDNSGGSQLWVSGAQWGPLAEHFLHLSFGRCAGMLVLREVIDGVPQGAVVPLPGRFLSGAMRGAINPRDGCIYVVGSRGWQTSAVRDGCLQRLRPTGRFPLMPVAINAHSNGLRVEFSRTLNRAAAEDAGSYSLTQWNYRYAHQYGSKDYSVLTPDREGHDELTIRSVRLLPGDRAVFLEIPGLGPTMQWQLKFNLAGVDGRNESGSAYGSIQRLGPSL